MFSGNGTSAAVCVTDGQAEEALSQPRAYGYRCTVAGGITDSLRDDLVDIPVPLSFRGQLETLHQDAPSFTFV
jgi:hypothetical protein